jgi:AraC-like DNA-binding protein
MAMDVVATAGPATRSGDPVADIVADVVATTRRNTAVYSRNLFHAPWGFGIPPMHVASFQVVTSGACWLVPAGGGPVHLTRGDVVLVLSGSGYAMVDAPGTPVRQLTELVGGPLGETPARKLILDGSGPATGLLCGGYLLETGPRHPLTAVLPPVVHIAAGQARGTGLAATVELLSDEVDRADPGAGAVITSLVELLFVYVLRAWLAEHSKATKGWVGALYDPVVGSALALIHREPDRPWSVGSLARAVGMPRTTFNRRFVRLTGHAPMTYVTCWRMSVASRLLREERHPLREIARRVGYDSEFAFARAFKRTVGQAPGRYRAAVDNNGWACPPA